MVSLRDMLDRRQGETDPEFLARVARENADLRIVTDIARAWVRGGVSVKGRARLAARAQRMEDVKQKARAIEMIEALPPK